MDVQSSSSDCLPDSIDAIVQDTIHKHIKAYTSLLNKQQRVTNVSLKLPRSLRFNATLSTSELLQTYKPDDVQAKTLQFEQTLERAKAELHKIIIWTAEQEIVALQTHLDTIVPNGLSLIHRLLEKTVEKSENFTDKATQIENAAKEKIHSAIEAKKLLIHLKQASIMLHKEEQQSATMEAETLVDNLPESEHVGALIQRELAVAVKGLTKRLSNLERNTSKNGAAPPRSGSKQGRRQQQRRPQEQHKTQKKPTTSNRQQKKKPTTSQHRKKKPSTGKHQPRSLHKHPTTTARVAVRKNGNQAVTGRDRRSKRNAETPDAGGKKKKAPTSTSQE